MISALRMQHDNRSTSAPAIMPALSCEFISACLCFQQPCGRRFHLVYAKRQNPQLTLLPGIFAKSVCTTSILALHSLFLPSAQSFQFQLQTQSFLCLESLFNPEIRARATHGLKHLSTCATSASHLNCGGPQMTRRTLAFHITE